MILILSGCGMYPGGLAGYPAGREETGSEPEDTGTTVPDDMDTGDTADTLPIDTGDSGSTGDTATDTGGEVEHYVAITWSPGGSYYLRFSYETGESQSEAGDGDGWYQYYVNDGVATSSLSVQLNEDDDHPVYAGDYVRFSFEADTDTNTSNGASFWNANHSGLVGTNSASFVCDGVPTEMTVSLWQTSSGGEGMVGPVPTCD